MDDEYKTFGIILVIVIAVMAFLWYRSDNGRVKVIQELREQNEKYEARIEELEHELYELRGY